MSSTLRGQYDKQGYALARVEELRRKLTSKESRRPVEDRLEEIEELAPQLRKLSDKQLQKAALMLREKLEENQGDFYAILEPAFGLVREASQRTVGLFHYPEQLLAGLTLVEGGIAEMATGEGKTLAISLPAFLFGLSGKGVHVATVNTYLAERDYEFTLPIFQLLGVTSGHLSDDKDRTKKKAAYQNDITYGVGYEFGFDYLRDQLSLIRNPPATPREKLRSALLKTQPPEPDVVQRPLTYAIIDEVDSVLIDEAGSPLLLSESSDTNPGDYALLKLARETALTLEEKVHYIDESTNRNIRLTRLGLDTIHGIDSIPWKFLRRPWQSYVTNALKAEQFFKRDVQYVVDDEGKVVIIDEFTGRRHEERTWRDGLHQAVECKEDVEIRPENRDAASITRQRYFARYETIAGLTGTAAESAGEFWNFFQLPVRTIPLHKPSRRTALPERVFRSREEMFAAVRKDIAERKAKGQPVLVGTRTIQVSEAIAEEMTAAEISFKLLTAKQDKEESELVSQAGTPGSVLIATNMAGRGTHIDLSPRSEEAGGLHVLVVERNESSRIDRQLIGRAARQGQPGSFQIFVSADDHLFSHYAPEIGERIRNAPADENGQVRTDFCKEIEQLQQTVERIRYDQRLKLARRDKWLDQTKKTLA